MIVGMCRLRIHAKRHPLRPWNAAHVRLEPEKENCMSGFWETEEILAPVCPERPNQTSGSRLCSLCVWRYLLGNGPQSTPVMVNLSMSGDSMRISMNWDQRRHSTPSRVSSATSIVILSLRLLDSVKVISSCKLRAGSHFQVCERG